MTGAGRRWPLWADPVIAAGIVAVAVVELSSAESAPPLRWGAALVMAAAPAWRRRAPVTVLLAVHAALIVHQLAGFDVNVQYTPLALYLAYYTVGAHRDLPAATQALLAGVGLMTVGSVLEGLAVAEFVFPGIIAVVVWGAGAGMRAKIAAAVAAEGRARTAEESRERAAAAAVTDERGRIARELHDVVAHSVSVMVMQAGALRRTLPADRHREAELARTVERIGREALVELRRMLGVLRDADATDGAPLSPQPGLARLDELVERTEAAGVPVALAVEQLPASLPPGIDLCAYRLVQESLTNVIKHAGRASARVEVRFPPGAVELTVVDDGRTAPSAANGGHGLVGMRERVAVFGGELSAGPEADGGFAVRARLPLESR